ncbi:MAG: hypothetical protein LW629_09800 [Burkholderiales bacterium]|nr:hypothetical protein [Burkholderiales bacterium]
MNPTLLPLQKSTIDTLKLLLLSVCTCVALSDVGNAGTREASNAKASSDVLSLESVTAMAEKVAKQQQAGVKKPIYVVNVFRTEKTPIAAVSDMENMCILVINKNPAGWAAWDESFKALDDKQRMAFVHNALTQETQACAKPSQEARSNGFPKLALSNAVAKHLDAASSKFTAAHGFSGNGLFHSAIAMEIRHVSPR